MAATDVDLIDTRSVVDGLRRVVLRHETDYTTWLDVKRSAQHLPPELTRLTANYGIAFENIGRVRTVIQQTPHQQKSNNTLDLLKKWAEFPIYSERTAPVAYYELGHPQKVLEVLQALIDVEFYTLPLYLSGMYSIDERTPGGQEAMKLFVDFPNGIVIQEMKHLGLALNIYNALAAITDKAPLPTITPPPYKPGKRISLPGGCLPRLTLELGPATRERVLSQYAALEQPNLATHGSIEQVQPGDISPIDENNNFTLTVTTVPYAGDDTEMIPGISPTIAALYTSVRKWFEANEVELEANGFGKRQTGGVTAEEQAAARAKNRQISQAGIGISGMSSVQDVKDAIDTIILEGESSREWGVVGGIGELSHYHKFLSLYVGQKVVEVEPLASDQPNELKFQFTTDGIPLQFDNDCVRQTLVQEKDLEFSDAYRLMVDNLQFMAQQGETRNSQQPEKLRQDLLQNAIHDMFRLKEAYLKAVAKGVAPTWELP